MKKGITKFVMIVPTSMVHSAAAKNASQCAKGGVAEANGVHIVHDQNVAVHFGKMVLSRFLEMRWEVCDTRV